MAQAGLHGLVSLPVRKWGGQREWLMLDSVLGSMLLFLIFLALAYTLSKGFLTIFGVVYLLSLGLAIGIVIRMRATIENPLKSTFQVVTACETVKPQSLDKGEIT